MRLLFIQVGSKCHPKCPYKREAGGDETLTEEKATWRQRDGLE